MMTRNPPSTQKLSSLKRLDDETVKSIIHELSENHLHDLEQLYKQGWWSSKRTLNDCRKIVQNSSLIFGMLNQDNKLIAFSRVLTDYFMFSYIYDVLVDREYQGLGLGRKLIESIIDYPPLQDVQYIELVCTKEMKPFYQKFGFSDDYKASVSLRYTRELI